MKVAWAMGTQENNWLRQVGGYWSMAASFVLQGALNEELFLQPGEWRNVSASRRSIPSSGLREKMGDPHFFLNIEKVITHTKWGRERLQFTLKRVETMRQKRAERKAS